MTDPIARDDSPKPDTTKGVLDLLLSVFAEVHPGEGLSAIVLMVDVMLLLIAYYLLKTVREPLILASGGVAAKNYATIVQAVVLMGFIPLYAALTKRLKRMTLITVTHLFFAANLVLFWILARIPVPGLGGAFFVWLGIFSLVIIAQFWSLANDLYTPAQGKRLFAILGIGGSVGAVAGSKLAEILFEPLGAFNIMLLSAGILVACLALSSVANAREHQAHAGKPEAKADEKPIGGKNGFALILANKYLLLIASVIMVLNLVNTTGESILDTAMISQVAADNPTFSALDKTCEEGPEKACATRDDKDACKAEVDDACAKSKKMIKSFVGPFRGRFFFWVNLVGAIVQLFFVSRIFKYLGIRAALFSLPVIALLAYGGMTVIASIAFIRIMKIAENSIDYSLYNTTKQALWLPTSREDK